MKTIEVRSIGELSARLVRDQGEEYVELFVRLKSAGPKADRLTRARESERKRRLKSIARRAKIRRAKVLGSKKRGRK